MSSDENDKSAEQVLEYYKKYSQNRNLPKYFSGTSVSYLPPIAVEHDKEYASLRSARTTLASELKIAVNELNVIDKSSPSTSSSESSSEHKKLEWDNGADIGYSSARTNSEKKLQKSSSLPILDSLKDLRTNLNMPTLVPSTIIAHSTSTENIGVLIFNSSNDSNKESSKNSAGQDPVSSSLVTTDNKEQPLSTYTSSMSDVVNSKVSNQSDSDETRFVNFHKSISYLKQKIGLPGAHSTPNVDNELDSVKNKDSASSKPALAALLTQDICSSSTSQDKLHSGSSRSKAASGSFISEVSKPTIHKETASSRKSSCSKPLKSSSKPQTEKVETKIIELSISTPINVNCKGPASNKNTLQTLNTVTSKAVQTEMVNQQHIETQFAFNSYQIGENIKQKSITRPETISVSEDMSDSASSFEYISIANKSSASLKSIKTKKGEYSIESHIKKMLANKATSITSVLKEISLSKSTTESSNVSRSSSEDIDRHLEMLHKLFKTKKINSSAKRKYIKKLLKELNELETSYESNTSSDLFIPKKDEGQEMPKSTLKSKVVFKEADDLILAYNNAEKVSSREDNEFQGENVFYTDHCSSDYDKSPVCQDIECVSKSKINKKLDCKDATNSNCPTKDLESTITNTGKEGTLAFDSDGSKHFGENNGDRIHILQTKQALSSKDCCAKGFHGKLDSKSSKRSFVHPCCCGQTVKKFANKDMGIVTSDISSQSVKEDCTIKTDITAASSVDYTLKFAENERTYQLHWINNEICHLSKLKNILELKDKKPSKPDEASHPKTSVYSVVRKDGSRTASQRNFVIETKLDTLPKQNINNYVLEGQEYVVSDTRMSSSHADRVVFADIEISSDKSQTNIKVRSLCSGCKQVICTCDSKKTIQSQFSSWSNESESIEICLSCQQIVCVCKNVGERSNVNIVEGSILEVATATSGMGVKESVNLDCEAVNVSSQSSDMEIISPEDFNSLQKVFKKCSCTVENPNCGCNFVRKLLDKFRVQTDVSTEAAQSDRSVKDRLSSMEHKRTNPSSINNASQTTKLGQETKVQTYITPTQNTELQVGVGDKHISLHTLRDVLSKSTQTQCTVVKEETQTDHKQTAKDKGLCTCGNVVTQTLNSQSNVDAQTFNKLKRDDTAEACPSCGDMSVQATKQTSSNNVQTDQKKFFKSTEVKHKECDCCCTRQKSINKNLETQTKETIRGDMSVQATKQTTSNDVQTDQKKLFKSTKGENKECDCCCTRKKSVDFYNKSLETLTQETNIVVDMAPSSSGKFKNIGIQVFPSFENNQVDHLHKNVEKNVNTEGIVFQKDVAIAESKTDIDQLKERGTQYDKTITNQSETGSASRSTPTTLSDSRTSGSSRIVCFCCKQKAFLAEVSYLQEGNDSFAVCSRCYYNRPRYCSHNPRLMCRCWTYFHANPNFETEQFCKCCRIEVSKCPKRLKGLAYTVTLQKGSSNRRRRKSSTSSVSDIKVQKGWSRKSLKNKENVDKRDVERKSSLGKKTGTVEINNKDKDEMEKDQHKRKSKKQVNKEDDIQYTLTEYLIKNRPEFICSAEYRRQMLLNSRILREQQKDALKFNFLENNLKNSNEGKYKLFTEREMRDINKNNYKKLPEVQEKLVNQRENRLRHADRLISNIFAKQVQKSVLQGRGDFPIDKPLTNL